MADDIAVAELTLSYPIFAADIDPHDPTLVLVGGGGGEGKSGIKNKLTLIDATKRFEVKELVDIELSSGEDSVSSLAVAQSDESSAVVFAGINSSAAERNEGRNEHLRSFRLGYATRQARSGTSPGDEGAKADEKPKKKSNVPTEPLGKAALFKPEGDDEHEAYQRILRLSQPRQGSSRRLGIVATGLAPQGEIVLFDAANTRPTAQHVRHRIQLEPKQEANGLDIIDALPPADGSSTESEAHLYTYCNDTEIWLGQAPLNPSDKIKSPRLIFSIPPPDVFNAKSRPLFRALRFLSPSLLLVAQNQPDRSGAELILLALPQSDSGQASVIQRRRLHRGIKGVTCLSTAVLAGPVAGAPVQHVIAVAGQDASLSILTVDEDPRAKSHRGLSLTPFKTMRSAHALPITALAFSSFQQPKAAHAPPQYLRLVSTSLDATVRVYALPLTPYPSGAAAMQAGTSRYTLRSLAGREDFKQTVLAVIMALFMVVLGAVLLQSWTEIRGGSPDIIGAKRFLPAAIRNKISRDYMFADGLPDTARRERETFRKLLGLGTGWLPGDPEVKSSDSVVKDLKRRGQALGRALTERHENGASPAKIVIHDDGSSGLRHELVSDPSLADPGIADGTSKGAKVQQAAHRTWEQLTPKEKKHWRQRLQDVGAVTANQGESVLKGICFAELAGAVAGAVRA